MLGSDSGGWRASREQPPEQQEGGHQARCQGSRSVWETLRPERERQEPGEDHIDGNGDVRTC